MVRILVDLSHNERFTQIPSGIFGIDHNFEFLYPGMHFPEYHRLREYNLIIMGEILPSENEMDHLFLKTEIDLLKLYVKNGGKVLLTTSSGGDFEYEREVEDIEEFGSIRALNFITGVKRYWWGELFHPSKGMYFHSPENLVITQFPLHPIFNGVSRVMLADATFLELSTTYEPEVVLTTQSGTKFRYYVDESEELVDVVPIITYRKVGTGACMVIGSTLFMSKHQKFGSSIYDNSKFFFNIINWLVR